MWLAELFLLSLGHRFASVSILLYIPELWEDYSLNRKDETNDFCNDSWTNLVKRACQGHLQWVEWHPCTFYTSKCFLTYPHPKDSFKYLKEPSNAETLLGSTIGILTERRASQSLVLIPALLLLFLAAQCILQFNVGTGFGWVKSFFWCLAKEQMNPCFKLRHNVPHCWHWN